MPKTEYVGVGKPVATGALFTAKPGTEVPTDGSSELAADFKDLGYASDAGVSNAFSESNTNIRAWGATIVRVTTEESTETFAYTMIETNEHTAKEFFGSDNVEGTMEDGTLKIVSNATEKVAHPWVVESLITPEYKERIVIPLGKVSELGEITYVDGQPLGYPITISALPDSEGNRAYRYIVKALEDV